MPVAYRIESEGGRHKAAKRCTWLERTERVKGDNPMEHAEDGEDEDIRWMTKCHGDAEDIKAGDKCWGCRGWRKARSGPLGIQVELMA